MKRKEKPHVCKTQGRLWWGSSEVRGEFQRKYRQSVSHEKKVQRDLGCCSSVAVKSLKLVVSACSEWSLQNGITQEFLNDSILFTQYAPRVFSA